MNHHFSLPAGGSGREALVDLLADRYAGDMRKFNRVYGLSLEAIEDLKSKSVLVYSQEFERANFPSAIEHLEPAQMHD